MIKVNNVTYCFSFHILIITLIDTFGRNKRRQQIGNIEIISMQLQWKLFNRFLPYLPAVWNSINVTALVTISPVDV